MPKDEDVSPLAEWQQNNQEAMKVLADFDNSGDVNWEEVLTGQREMLDKLLSAEDRRLSRKRSQRRIR